MGYFRWTPEKVEKLFEMKNAGKSIREIALIFNTTESIIRNRINRETVKKQEIKSNKSSNSKCTHKQISISDKQGNKEMSNSIALRKQAEELLKAASEMEERENFNKHKYHIRNKLNEIINDYDHLGEKIEELKEMLK